MFKRYKRKGLAECRPYIKGESLTYVSISDADDPINDVGGMVARNPDNHEDQWYIAGEYFRTNFDYENPIEIEL